MKLGLSLGHSTGLRDLAAVARRADAAGLDSLWVSEAYGSDAVSVLAYLAAVTSRIGLGTAVLQMPARTPAATAMTALTLDQLSEGRLLLGLGTSGPQVVEGWHGVAFDSPLARTREYVDIVRAVVARRDPLTYPGVHYPLPYPRPDRDPPRPLKATLHPTRPRIPVLLAANGPRNVALAGQLAEGWLPAFYCPDRPELYHELLAPGLARRSADLGPLRVVATVHLAPGADLAACRDALRPVFALYLGGMGTRGRNFYADLASRLGYGAAAQHIQDLYLDGHRTEAAAAVPDALIDQLALVGPRERIRDRLAAWADAGVDVLTLKTTDVDLAAWLATAL
ncbi:LLM class F420-dependent oxidoreductase [Dactylosporangium sucinum]|uniref:LLM class F420-dependent oxidoreductase n=1 Tax=Dactylosporangium sucinum TaxID=1424081 RepID=A0A917U050_9ACTN|nr:LLM class F420-dependent oxidoreductase [Dactylosporangium sucinum]GGM45637.1 LLM class F420-dependent oxidoreductase [Dactylosporangium sucinum]